MIEKKGLIVRIPRDVGEVTLGECVPKNESAMVVFVRQEAI